MTLLLKVEWANELDTTLKVERVNILKTTHKKGQYPENDTFKGSVS